MPQSAFQECLDFIATRSPKPKLAQGRLYADASQDQQPSVEETCLARIRIGDSRSHEIATLREVKESPHMPGIFYGRDSNGKVVTFHYSQFIP